MIYQYYNKLNQTHYENVEATWKDIADAIRNPITTIVNREDIPLWSFYTTVKEPELSYGLPHACADNFLTLHVIQLDFHDGVSTIDWFKETYKQYRFLLYTSFRSKPEHHKFRVIMPLMSTFANVMMRCKAVTQDLSSKFPGCDTSTFNSFRRQRVPAVNPETPANYTYHINNGVCYDIDQFAYLPAYNTWKAKRDAYLTPSTFFTMDINQLNRGDYNPLTGIERKLSAESWEEGSRNNTMFKYVGWMRSKEIDNWEISQLMHKYIPSDMFTELESMLRR